MNVCGTAALVIPSILLECSLSTMDAVSFTGGGVNSVGKWGTKKGFGDGIISSFIPCGPTGLRPWVIGRGLTTLPGLLSDSNLGFDFLDPELCFPSDALVWSSFALGLSPP